MSQQENTAKQAPSEEEEQKKLQKLEEPTKKIKQPLPKAIPNTNDEDFNPDESASDEDILDDGIESSQHSSIDLQEYLKFCEEEKKAGNIKEDDNEDDSQEEVENIKQVKEDEKKEEKEEEKKEEEKVEEKEEQKEEKEGNEEKQKSN